MKNCVKPFKKVLVANRGEIAIRIFRALAELDIKTVGIYSKEDKMALFRTKADESYLIGEGKGPIDAYLDMDTIIHIAKTNHVDAIHPGYGFLSENPDFANKCAENNIVFIGPDVLSMKMMGDKISSKKVAKVCGVPTIPGVFHAIKTADEALKIAKEIGYPVILKAANGGGGRGMRIVKADEELATQFEDAKNESIRSFGDDQIFIEKYLFQPKHIEVQILGDAYGNIVHLYERDCSLQRRHQKVIEFAPSITLDSTTREQILEASVKLASHVKYKNAGTLEFLVDGTNFYFIEMNPRIQVEHTISEMITGIDIVQSQILIAMGYPLSCDEIAIHSQEDVHIHGYSIQCRVTTEDPSKNFSPDYGKISVYRSGSGFGIRLDAGAGFTGYEITPYYDSLLVKVISWDRSFHGARKKALRSIKELRIRGVKTNTSFLVNVLNHPTFIEGNCYTSFIEDTKELFNIKDSKDRASKLLKFVGDVIVNENSTITVHSDYAKLPTLPLSPQTISSKALFDKMGAYGFTQMIKNDSKLYITDTTMRDAHQSLLATRLRTYDLEQIAPYYNQVLKDSFSVETWGGATFDVAYRFLKESPWRRLEKLSQAMPNVMQQMLLRASSTVGYKNYPDNVVSEFIRVCANSGIDVFRIFDSLNWIENMKLPIEIALQTGKIVEGSICYTSDLLDPKNTKYTLEYYIKKAKELEKLGVHVLGIKDMSALLKPYAAKLLITALKDELSIPIHLHTHDSTGNGVSTVLMAAQAGVDIVDGAIESMSGLTSQPSLNSIVEALKHTPRDTLLSTDDLKQISTYFKGVRSVYSKFETDMKTPCTEIYNYEIPGGQYSNLLPQIKSMGLENQFEEVKMMFKHANDLLGNIVKVTPSSKIVGDLAIFMVKNNLTNANILEKGKDISFPESVVEYFKGLIGQPDGGFPKQIQAVVLKDQKPIDCRPGELLQEINFQTIKEHLDATYKGIGNERNILSYALYPKVYEQYCKHIETYNDISKLPSNVFFGGLHIGQDIDIEIEQGKILTIKYIGISEIVNGIYTLTFEVNGSQREIEIIDKSVKTIENRKQKADRSNPLHLCSSMPGKVDQILVELGELVKVNQPLFVVEAMKMETTILSKIEGVIDQIFIEKGQFIADDELAIVFA
ncbi:MAG: pyruvate carboxylase [Oscillospiraceae bacterium]